MERVILENYPTLSRVLESKIAVWVVFERRGKKAQCVYLGMCKMDMCALRCTKAVRTLKHVTKWGIFLILSTSFCNGRSRSKHSTRF